MRHERQPAPAAALSERQQRLRDATVRSASAVDEQLMMLRVLSTRLGASESDVRAVRAHLVAHVARECGDLR